MGEVIREVIIAVSCVGLAWSVANVALGIAHAIRYRKLGREQERALRLKDSTDATVIGLRRIAAQLQSAADSSPDPARAVVLRRAAANIAVEIERIK